MKQYLMVMACVLATELVVIGGYIVMALLISPLL